MPYLPPFQKLSDRMTIAGTADDARVATTLGELRAMVRRLLDHVVVDETWYLTRYPDVAMAIRDGRAQSARDHFLNNGYFEGRWPNAITVDEAWYLAEYPEVAKAIREGVVSSAQQHFEENGYREGRRPWPEWDRPS